MGKSFGVTYALVLFITKFITRIDKGILHEIGSESFLYYSLTTKHGHWYLDNKENHNGFFSDSGLSLISTSISQRRQAITVCFCDSSIFHFAIKNDEFQIMVFSLDK